MMRAGAGRAAGFDDVPAAGGAAGRGGTDWMTRAAIGAAAAAAAVTAGGVAAIAGLGAVAEGARPVAPAAPSDIGSNEPAAPVSTTTRRWRPDSSRAARTR